MWEYNYADELYHFGILGMKWGHRKNGESKTKSRTVRLATKDAKRYAEAKMFYGETAGTKRKLLNAELNRKKKRILGYELEFDKAVESADFSKAAKKAVRKRKSIDGWEDVKTVIGVSGSVTVAAAGALYAANHEKINAFMVKQANRAIQFIKNRR